MNTTQLERLPESQPRTDGSVGRAWLAVVLIPVFLFISFALTGVLYDVFGYAPENNDAPLWVDVIAALFGLAVFLIPCLAAMFFGRRATRDGDRRGLLPLGIGAIAGSALTVLTVVTTVADALR